MRNIFICTAILILLFGFQTHTEAANKTKIIIGSCLLAGGTALSIHAADNVFDPNDAEFGIGIGLAAGGAALLMWGLLQDGKSEMKQNVMMPGKKAWEVAIGVMPRRGGLSGGMSIRW